MRGTHGAATKRCRVARAYVHIRNLPAAGALLRDADDRVPISLPGDGL